MFKVNGEYWEIKIVPWGHPLLSDTFAVCDDFNKTIYIAEDVFNNTSLLRKVLYHEITHAVMFSYSTALTVKEEELLADLVATYGQEIIFIANKIYSDITKNKGRT